MVQECITVARETKDQAETFTLQDDAQKGHLEAVDVPQSCVAWSSKPPCRQTWMHLEGF